MQVATDRVLRRWDERQDTEQVLGQGHSRISEQLPVTQFTGRPEGNLDVSHVPTRSHPLWGGGHPQA